ncbi:hypothetical protein Hte_007839 [Hypoxylon texense]
MSRTELSDNRIFFFEYSAHYEVPDSVKSLRETLLDFFCTVIDRLGTYREDAFEQPSCLLPILQVFDEDERTQIAATIDRHDATKKRALALQWCHDLEQEWVDFFHEHFFDPLASKFDVTNSDSRRAYNRPWSLFSDQFRLDHKQTASMTQPIPDLTASFSIFDFRTDGSQWPRMRWLKDIMVENFSRATLERLCKHGLHPSATGTYHEGREEGIDPSSSVCYPWLIVEHQKAGQRTSAECYCRAANDAAAALMMFRRLARYSADNIPPVVTMTTVGEIVGIWIAFFDTKQEAYKMIRIWKGFMTTIVDIVKLEAILENLHTWATRVLKPWISHCIDQWKRYHPADTISDFHNIGRSYSGLSSANIDTKAPDPKQTATTQNEVEGVMNINSTLDSKPAPLLRIEALPQSRSRVNSDPFPRPSAAFIANQPGSKSASKETWPDIMMNQKRKAIQRPYKLWSNSCDDDDTWQIPPVPLEAQADPDPDPDIGVTDGSTAGQKMHDVRAKRKVLASETTGRRIRVKLPSLTVDRHPSSDHSSLREIANEAPISSPISDLSIEDIIPARSPPASPLSNYRPFAPTWTPAPPTSTDLTFGEKAALAWKSFRDKSFPDPADPKPLQSAMTRYHDPRYSVQGRWVDNNSATRSPCAGTLPTLLETEERETGHSHFGGPNVSYQSLAPSGWKQELSRGKRPDNQTGTNPRTDWWDDKSDTVRESELTVRENGLTAREKGLVARENQLIVRENGITRRENELTVRENGLTVREKELTVRESELVTRENELMSTENELMSIEGELTAREEGLTAREEKLTARENELADEPSDDTPDDTSVDPQARKPKRSLNYFNALSEMLETVSTDSLSDTEAPLIDVEAADMDTEAAFTDIKAALIETKAALVDTKAAVLNIKAAFIEIKAAVTWAEATLATTKTAPADAKADPRSHEADPRMTMISGTQLPKAEALIAGISHLRGDELGKLVETYLLTGEGLPAIVQHIDGPESSPASEAGLTMPLPKELPKRLEPPKDLEKGASAAPRRSRKIGPPATTAGPRSAGRMLTVRRNPPLRRAFATGGRSRMPLFLRPFYLSPVVCQFLQTMEAVEVETRLCGVKLVFPDLAALNMGGKPEPRNRMSRRVIPWPQGAQKLI